MSYISLEKSEIRYSTRILSLSTTLHNSPSGDLFTGCSHLSSNKFGQLEELHWLVLVAWKMGIPLKLPKTCLLLLNTGTFCFQLWQGMRLLAELKLQNRTLSLLGNSVGNSFCVNGVWLAKSRGH